MLAKVEQRWLILLVVTVIGCLMILEACGQSYLPTATLSPSSTPVELPAFLSHISLYPDTLVSKRMLGGKLIWATLRLEEIAESGETLGLEKMQRRVDLLIDGEIWDSEVERTSKPGAAEVEIVGGSDLGLGEHKATVRVRRTSGEILEYSWTFTVVAEEPSLPGLPEGLQFVRPLPDSTITMQAYQEEYLISSYFAPVSYLLARGAVCVGINPAKLLGPDELCLDIEDASRRYSFVTLNGVSPDADARIGEEWMGADVVIVDETGNEISQGCLSNHCKCWKVDLTPGEHEVTVRLEQSSGREMEYSWRFTITSD